MIYFFIFAVSFIIVFLMTPNIRYLALRFDVVDKRNHRKVHRKVITKLGGLAIYSGFLGGLAAVAFFDILFFKAHTFQMMGLIICSTLVLLLGMYDDFQGSNASTKLVVQITAALLLVKIGFILDRISIPGLIDISLGRLSIPMTVLWLVGITNAINLIDGLDGLAAGIMAVVSLFLSLHAFFLNENFVVYAALALLGANLAFLRYNFYPAKIFMGDTGSLFLGFTIGALGIYRSSPQSLNNLFFLPVIFLLLLPIADTSMAVVRRALKRKHIFRSDSSHIHHYYIRQGLSQPQVAMMFYLATFCLGVVSLSIVYGHQIFKIKG